MTPDTVAKLNGALEGRYRLERELGSGGMATVYLAQDVRHDRHVAIKVFRPEVAAVLGPERFLREIEIAAKLTHPHIVPLHDSGEVDGLLFYVMPYIGGESMRDRLERERQLPLDEAIRITREVASGLAHAHRQGVVHRDIKPENILLSDGHAMVADFGIASAVTHLGGERLTDSGLSIGTPAYMSPEQSDGESIPDARSDIYSLACVLYELLAGEAAHRGGTPAAVLARKVFDTVPSLRVVRRTVSEELEAAIMRALETVPADRFATVEEFAEALTAGSGTGQTQAHAEPLASERPSSRRKRAAIAVGVIALGLLGVWAADRVVNAGPPSGSLVVLPLENASGDAEQSEFIDGLHTAMIGELTKVEALSVTASASSLRYRDSELMVPEIATELGVSAVLRGSVLRVEEFLEVTLELVDGASGLSVWQSPRYAAPFEDAFASLTDIALDVAEQMDQELTPSDEARLAAVRPISEEAFRAYFNAHYLTWQIRPDDFDRALGHIERAIAADSTWAAPHALLADWHVLSQYHGVLPAVALLRAQGAATRAIELDPDLFESHLARAIVLSNQPDESIEWLESAVDLKPGDARARFMLATMLAGLGRDAESVAHARTAIRLDPSSSPVLGQASYAFEMAGRFEEAVDAAERALAIDPGYDLGYLRLAWAKYGLGDDEGVAEAAEIGLALSAGTSAEARWMAQAAELYAYIGREAEARRLIAELEGREGVINIHDGTIGSAFVGLGDFDSAMTFFYRALASESGDLDHALLCRRLEPIYDHPPFREFLEQIDLPEGSRIAEMIS